MQNGFDNNSRNIAVVFYALVLIQIEFKMYYKIVDGLNISSVRTGLVSFLQLSHLLCSTVAGW